MCSEQHVRCRISSSYKLLYYIQNRGSRAQMDMHKRDYLDESSAVIRTNL